MLVGQVAPDTAGGERLQCRDQKGQVAERAERKLERILELGALDRDVAMEARTQVRRNNEQALVNSRPSATWSTVACARVNRTIWICSGIITGTPGTGSTTA